MHFRCERDVLVDALKAASRAVGRKGGALPILGCLRLTATEDRLTVEGTDLEVAISVAAVVATVEDGQVAIPAKILLDVVAAFPPGAVTMKDDEQGSVALSSGRSSFTLRTANTEDWPNHDWPEGDASTIPAKELLGAIDRVVPAASTDDSRPILTGVLLERRDEKMRLVATDSYRLMYEDLDDRGAALGDVVSVLVPADALGALAKVAAKVDEVSVYLDERSVTFAVGDELRVSCRLIEGAFPNYAGLLPKEGTRVGRLTASRADMVEVVKQARILARESTPVRLRLGDTDGPSLRAITQDVGTANVAFDGAYDGTSLEIGFNPSYLLDALEAAPGDEVTLDVVDARNPAVLRSPGADQFLALLMPVRFS